MPFDMKLFLTGVLTGLQATRNAICDRLRLSMLQSQHAGSEKRPGLGKESSFAWFLDHHLDRRSEATRYYYKLTIRLLARRLEKSWVFK